MMPFILANTAHGTMIVPLNDHNTNADGMTYGVGAQILHHGRYEQGEVELLGELLRLRRQHHGDDVVMMDCGANIGVLTVECARLMAGTGQERPWGIVVGIEAQERLFYALAGNVTINNLLNVRVMWGAVTDKAGRIGVADPDYSKPGSFGSFELRERPDGLTEDIGQPIDRKNPTTMVPAWPIDIMNIERLDVLKIDVEGMELEALRGAKATIERCRPIILVERIKVDEVALMHFMESVRYKTAPSGMNMLACPEEVKYLDWDFAAANSAGTEEDAAIRRANEVGESGDPREAMDILENSGLLGNEFHPLHHLAWLNYATLHMQVNKFKESLSEYQIVIDGGNPELRDLATFGRGFARLRLGAIRDGFLDFESRKRQIRPEAITQFPEWKGEDIFGKTLLVVGEMGFGDNIMFSRYFSHLVNMSIHVLVTVQPTLEPLMACLPHVQVYGKYSPKFDCWVDMMSLAHRCGTDVDTIPPPAKFHLPPKDVARWKGAVIARTFTPGRLKVGLCWSGGRDSQYDKHRNIPLEALRPLFDIEGIDFYSLQLDVRDTDKVMFREVHIWNMESNLPNFLETACAIETMDLVITVDTAVAHLAGSLGVPTWVMLTSYRTYWLWQVGKLVCPWYPFARSYQQVTDGDWSTVVEEIEADLRASVAK
jgi:FkbM family methyltransferase